MKKFNLITLLFIVLISGTLEAQISVPVDIQTGNPIIDIPVYTVTSGTLSVPVNLYYTPGIPASEQFGSDIYGLGIGWGLNAGGSITRSVRGLPDDFQGTGGDTRQGWLYGTAAAAIPGWAPAAHTSACSSDAANYAMLSGFTNSNADTEPDVFNFNFGGYSGQFVFDNNKVIQTLPYQDLKIQPVYSSSGAISSFTITTNSGVQYQFIPITTVTMNAMPNTAGAANSELYLRDKLVKYSINTTFTTTWGLSSVTSPSGATISFQYSTAITSKITIPTNIFLANNATGIVRQNTIYNVNTNTSQSFVTSISGGGISLNFSYTNDFALSNFQVISTGNIIMPSNIFTMAMTYEGINNRKYLVSLQTSNNCVKSPAYLFNYIGVNLANYSSTLPSPDLQGGTICPSYCYVQNPSTQYQSDYWGYYNANGASTRCPNLYVYPNEAMPDRYRLEQIPNYTGIYNYIGGGADRRVNTNAITAGTLNMITFPTGGNVKIDYESNQYFDNKANTVFNGGGIRVKTVTVHDGVNEANDIIKNYTYGTGLLINKPQFAVPIPVFTDNSGVQHTIDQYSDEPTKTEFFMIRTEYDMNSYSFDSPNVIYQSGAEVQTGKGKTIYTYATPATYGVLTSTEYSSPNQWQATYSTYASTVNPNTNACMSLGMAADGYYGFPFPTNPNYTFERGLLQSEQMINENGQLVAEKDYTYTPIYQATAPNYIYGVATDYFTYSPSDVNTRLYNYAKYGLYVGINKYKAAEKDITYDPTNLSAATINQNSYAFNDANHTLLSSMTSTASNDGINFTSYLTRYKYIQDFSGSLNAGADSATVAIQTLNNDFANSSVVEMTTSIVKPGLTEQVTGSTLNIYKVFTSFGLNRPLLYKTFAFKTNTPVTNFQPATIGPTYKFTSDSRYQPVNSFVDYNIIGNIYSENDGHHNLKGIQYDISGSVPVAKINNGLASQMVYSNFDDERPSNFPGPTVYSFDHALNGRSAYTIVPGRVGSAMSVIPNFVFQKAGVNRGTGKTYIFSCWIKATATGTMTINLSDNSGNSAPTQTITYSNVSGVWTYYKISIPVGNLNAVINLTAQSNVAIIIDDMLFYPTMAQVSLTSYQNFQKIAETDNHGNTTFYTNDDIGRPLLISDQNQNILKRMAYNYNVNYALNANFVMPPSALQNSVVSFQTGPSDGCEPAGIVRNWNFGDGSTLNNDGTTPTHTYTSTGAFPVTLTVTSPIYGTVSSTQNINITYPQVAFDINACGVVAFNVCYNAVVAVGNDMGVTCGSNLPVGTNTFIAVPSQDCANGAGSTYAWAMAYDTSPTTWVTVPGTTSSVTVSLPLNAQGYVNVNQSYTMRCTMQPNCNAQSCVKTIHISYMAPTCSHP